MVINQLIDELKWNIFERPVWSLLDVFYESEGFSVLDQNWDYLFICDACRHDLFKQNNTLPGKLECVWSRGGETGEFLENNFMDTYHEDIVYVSATPRHHNYISDLVFEYIPVWESEWEKNTGLVQADRMAEYCIEATKEYPNKRIIFHFLQPHLSIYSAEGINRPVDVGIESDKSVLRKFIEGKISKQFPGESPWLLYQEGYASKEDIWQLQERKLKEFLSEVIRISPHLQGDVIITSDHGNCYGEKVHPKLPWRAYEHPKKLNHPSLRRVPWFSLENTEGLTSPNREGFEISTNDSKSENSADMVEERLRDLGYL